MLARAGMEFVQKPSQFLVQSLAGFAGQEKKPGILNSKNAISKGGLTIWKL